MSSRMQATIKLDNPDEMMATMTISMTLADWKLFQQQLARSWPSCDLDRAVSDVMRKATVHFRSEP